MYFRQIQELTHMAALIVLQGAIAKAEAINVPECISIVDTGGNLLVFVRMDGAKVLSQLSATQKAIAAASSRVPTGGLAAEVELKAALATAGQLTNLEGGLPIVIKGQMVGAIGVGSGPSAEDVEVAKAGTQALVDAIDP